MPHDHPWSASRQGDPPIMGVPREDPTTGHRAYTLRLQKRAVDALTEASLLSAFPWRDWTLYDLSKCEHTSMKLVHVENPHGAWDVEICVNCGSQVSKHCPHEKNTWNDEGTVLTCDNCGIDGT